jgi:hypothetical protein
MVNLDDLNDEELDMFYTLKHQFLNGSTVGDFYSLLITKDDETGDDNASVLDAMVDKIVKDDFDEIIILMNGDESTELEFDSLGLPMNPEISPEAKYVNLEGDY